MSCTQNEVLGPRSISATTCTQTLHLPASGACPWCRPLPIHSQLRQDPCPRSQVSRAVHGREGLSGSPRDRSKSAISFSSCRRSSPSRVRGQTSARAQPRITIQTKPLSPWAATLYPEGVSTSTVACAEISFGRACGEGDFGVLSHHVLAQRRIFRRLAPGRGKAKTSRHQKKRHFLHVQPVSRRKVRFCLL